MPDYSKGKIYAIRAPGTDDVYIGSTTRTLAQRFASHRSYYKSGSAEYSSAKILGMDGCYIELIENYPCDSIEKLNRREGEVIRATPTAINKKIAGRTKAERRTENKNQVKAYQKAWEEKKKAEAKSAIEVRDAKIKDLEAKIENMNAVLKSHGISLPDTE